MEKPADTQYPIHDLLRRRWSPRAFAERMVEPEKLRSLFEAARWAPSCFNAQPWRFVIATRDVSAEHERLLNCLVEGNRAWAHRVPVLILSVAKLTFDDGSPNRHAWHDVGLAVENLIVQATAFGLAVHQMAGFDAGKARTEVKLPDGFEPVAMIAVGYPGDPSMLPEKLHQKELASRARKPSRDFVFAGDWGKPAPLISR